jgi:hypothetical protein
MDYEQELKRVADRYTSKGFQVTLHPAPADLPLFAQGFKVEIVGKRGAGGVLVSVKKNHGEMQADNDMPRYAEITGNQPGWRYDFAILEAEDPLASETRGASEPSLEEIAKTLASVDQAIQAGFLNSAFLAAWAMLEAAMRRRLRASGEPVGWGTQPRSMLNALYSNGILLSEDFPRLESAWKLRNEIAHGFAARPVDAGTVRFLVETANRLVEESESATQAV